MLNARITHLIDQFHFVININDYFLRLDTLEELMVLSFKMNKQNYARYGTYYLTQIESLDRSYLRTREEIQEKGNSVFRNNIGIRQLVEIAGQQVFMKNLKNAAN